MRKSVQYYPFLGGTPCNSIRTPAVISRYFVSRSHTHIAYFVLLCLCVCGMPRFVGVLSVCYTGLYKLKDTHFQTKKRVFSIFPFLDGLAKLNFFFTIEPYVMNSYKNKETHTNAHTQNNKLFSYYHIYYIHSYMYIHIHVHQTSQNKNQKNRKSARKNEKLSTERPPRPF